MTSKLRAKMWLSKPSCRGGKWLFATCPACISTTHTFILQWWSNRRARIALMSPIPFISQLPHLAVHIEAAEQFMVEYIKASSVYVYILYICRPAGRRALARERIEKLLFKLFTFKNLFTFNCFLSGKFV